MIFRLCFAIITLSLLPFPPHAQSAEPRSLPLPGAVFEVEGHVGFVITPQSKPPAKVRPWVWYAPTLPGLPGNEEKWMFERFLNAGIAIAGIDVGESYGSPRGRALYSAFYDELTQRRGFAAKPVMLGRSRGGLMTLSWAAENADKVGGFAGIYPVCNLASYPGIAKAAGAYQLTAEELEAQLKEHNPIDRLASLAKANVPLFAIHGDVDEVVPLNANSGLVKERYTALGGSMELIVPPWQGHNMWPGFFQSHALVDFVKKHAGPNIILLSPLDYQVIQRSSKETGRLMIRGELSGFATPIVTVEARLLVSGQAEPWQVVPLNSDRRQFEKHLEVPAGGWHRLEVRARSTNDVVVGEFVVEHVGMGEVFVIAGQSNSANHGEEKQNTQSGLVAAFHGLRWQVAHDPQPGASGDGGSFIPIFGDAMVAKFHVPVGIVACGVGATSVREWLPRDTAFTIPPTLTGNVRQVSTAEWASDGAIFTKFADRMRALGPHGFRAVLWHQGESDANQRDSTRTLPGRFYREYLELLIQASRQKIEWKAPWFVAQASYHAPGDEGSDDIRSAQASLWKDGTALEGPDTDALKGELRDNKGQGVHFSGAGLREHGTRWAEKVGPWLEKQVR